jgi:hypothetical protein
MLSEEVIAVKPNVGAAKASVDGVIWDNVEVCFGLGVVAGQSFASLQVISFLSAPLLFVRRLCALLAKLCFGSVGVGQHMHVKPIMHTTSADHRCRV